MLILRLLFVAGAMAVMISGIVWWIQKGPVSASADAMLYAKPVSYAGRAPVTKQLATTLSTYRKKQAAEKGRQYTPQQVENRKNEEQLVQRFGQAEEKKDFGGMKQVLKDMSSSYKAAGETEMAVAINKQAVALGKKRGERRDVADSLNEISGIYNDAAKLDQAIEYGERALREYRDIDARDQMVRVFRHLGTVYKKKGLEEEAKKCLKNADRLVKGMKPDIDAFARKLATSSGLTKKPGARGSKPSQKDEAADEKVDFREDLDATTPPSADEDARPTGEGDGKGEGEGEKSGE
jgi:tetratricopeptide (TPR) repeat protein